MFSVPSLAGGMCLLLLGVFQNAPAASAQVRPAAPLDPASAIIEAFDSIRSSALVARTAIAWVKRSSSR